MGDTHHGGCHVEVGRRGLEVEPARTLDRGVAAVHGRPQRGQRAVLGDQLGSGLVADAPDTGQPVTGVAAQHRHLEVRLAGGHGVPLLQVRLGGDVGLAHSALARVEHPDAVRVVDELEQVPVAGDDVHRHHPAVAVGEGADDVVGLEPRGAQACDADRAQRLSDERYLGGEVVGRLLGDGGALDEPVGLVRGDEVNPPLRPPVVVPAGDEVGRAVCRDEGGDHVDEATQRVGRGLVGALALVRHTEERAEVQRGAVEQDELAGPTGGR